MVEIVGHDYKMSRHANYINISIYDNLFIFPGKYQIYFHIQLSIYPY